MEPAFPAIYSTLCPVVLSSLITDQYELENVECKFLVRGVGDTYFVNSQHERFIFRVYRPTHRTLSVIEEEINLLLALKEAQVSVSYPIADVQGAYILKINAIEGDRHAVLFSFAPGKVVRQMSKSQLCALGNEMARFHNVSALFQKSGARWNFDLDTMLYQPLERLKTVFTENQEDYIWLESKVNQIKNKFSKIDTEAFSTGYCHFDFLPKNFHFDGDSVTFFDFDFMGYGWLVNDIMTFWQHLVLDVLSKKISYDEAMEAYHIFLQGYKEHRMISDLELEMVPYLTFGFWLFYMNFHTTHDQFYAFSQPAYLKSYVGILKDVAENYWLKEDQL
ncbi:hypothetical protein C1631_002625 [Chryseobacterium phosphatilyticum]|uniref:Aminoglycoside phosphotransferase domain-containing protein n=1 Tax=Chryseobacterium phosphatilyticum TaxID=475075 RepID=A0A316XCW5_9FLAO|nr:phosphotransferase [Chryseobacterium phosphatilyticum]PWN71537.1 hypothetical protein C1631_002625 [Chryseobacterium phosphatilyticum]